MTPEEQHLAILKACGWLPVGAGTNWFWKDGIGQVGFDLLPDYTKDLNAMHEAEKVLFPVHVCELSNPDKWAEYREILTSLSVGNPGGALRATAAQRAESFLRAIGKWKD